MMSTWAGDFDDEPDILAELENFGLRKRPSKAFSGCSEGSPHGVK